MRDKDKDKFESNNNFFYAPCLTVFMYDKQTKGRGEVTAKE